MNWYKKAHLNKISSVTFWIEGSDRITQPMNKLDICNDLSEFVFYDLKLGRKLGFSSSDDFDPDTSSGDFNEYTGQINIYLENPAIKSGIISNILEQYNKEKELINLSLIEINKSGVRDVNVARVSIDKNDTVNTETIPRMNLANPNALALIQLLENEGMGNLEKPGGSINVDSLRTVLDNIDQNRYLLQTYTQEPSEETNPGQATMIDQGRSYERMERYINGLREMVDYIDNNNFPVKIINYG